LSLLLLLDNVEHLLPPAADEIAALRAANGSRLLVTSRERLRIAGEQTWPVPPLAEQDASALFLTRAYARLLRPGMAIITDKQPPAPTVLADAISKIDRAIERLWNQQEIAA